MSNALKRPISRLAYRRDEAAAALGVSPNKFSDWVRDGRMPKPVKIDGCVLWDADAVTAAWQTMRDAAGAVDSTADWDAHLGV